MSDDRVYCCNKEATCNNYERSELVFFEQVKFEKGFVWEKWKTSGICWIFLLSGEAGVSIEDEVVFVEAGEMFLFFYKFCRGHSQPFFTEFCKVSR